MLLLICVWPSPIIRASRIGFLLSSSLSWARPLLEVFPFYLLRGKYFMDSISLEAQRSGKLPSHEYLFYETENEAHFPMCKRSGAHEQPQRITVFKKPTWAWRIWISHKNIKVLRPLYVRRRRQPAPSLIPSRQRRVQSRHPATLSHEFQDNTTMYLINLIHWHWTRPLRCHWTA